MSLLLNKLDSLKGNKTPGQSLQIIPRFYFLLSCMQALCYGVTASLNKLSADNQKSIKSWTQILEWLFITYVIVTCVLCNLVYTGLYLDQDLSGSFYYF